MPGLSRFLVQILNLEIVTGIGRVVIVVVIKNDDIKFITTCPPVIFAAKRNIRLLVVVEVSTSTKNGFSHSGALSRSKCAIFFF